MGSRTLEFDLWTAVKQKIFGVLTEAFGDEQGKATVPVLRGPAKGFRFRQDLVNRREIRYILGTYDERILKRLKTICKEGWVIWDIGTFLGFYTCFFARLVGASGRVVAFEPDPRNMALTRENVKLNHLGNVQFEQAAIGAPVRETEFIPRDDSQSHIPRAHAGENQEEYRSTETPDAQIKVSCLSLDDAYQHPGIPPPNLIKMDIEGAESDALKYGTRLFNEKKPIVLLELHNQEARAVAWSISRATNYQLQLPEVLRSIENPHDLPGTVLWVPVQ